MKILKSLLPALIVVFGLAAAAIAQVYVGGPNAVAGLPSNNTFTGALNQFGSSTIAPTAPSHIGSGQATAPALTSCGTSPAITGTDTAGIVTMGTGSPTGCVITFTTAYTAAPYCVVTWIATPLASQSYVTAAASITLTQTATSSNKVQYICIAQNGG